MKLLNTVFITILIFAVILIALITWGCEDDWCYVFPWQKTVQKACTMEAKLCPDGSYVGRTGPNCEFTPCPSN